MLLAIQTFHTIMPRRLAVVAVAKGIKFNLILNTQKQTNFLMLLTRNALYYFTHDETSQLVLIYITHYHNQKT